MNKKMMAMVATAAMAFAANAAKEYVDGYTWEYTVSGGAATVTGVEPVSGNLIIPSKLGGCPVKTIGASAFESKSGISSVKIPEGVTRIESKAFWLSRIRVEIPYSVAYIGDWALVLANVSSWHLNENCTVIIAYDPFVDSIGVLYAEGDSPSWFSTQGRVVSSFYCKRQYAKNWIATAGYSNFAGYIDDAPEVEIVSARVRENDPTVMDVVYKVYSDAATVKVRALAFQDGQRSFAKVVPVKTLIEGTDANIGDSVTANVEHKLSWKVSTDWATDLAKVKFEVLAVEDDILPLELQTIPATANHAAMKISWNKMTDDKVFDALLWLYASGDTGLTLTNGQLRNGGTILASGTGIYNGQGAVTYIFGKMGYGVLSGNDLTYARRVTQLDLPTGGVQQFAVKTIAQ